MRWRALQQHPRRCLTLRSTVHCAMHSANDNSWRIVTGSLDASERFRHTIDDSLETGKRPFLDPSIHPRCKHCLRPNRSNAIPTGIAKLIIAILSKCSVQCIAFTRSFYIQMPPAHKCFRPSMFRPSNVSAHRCLEIVPETEQQPNFKELRSIGATLFLCRSREHTTSAW